MASYKVPSVEIQPDGSVVIGEGFTSISTPEIREPIQKHGAKLAKSHIFNVEEVRKDGITEIRGCCLHETAISEPPYFIKITLNQDREVIKGHCSCVSGTDAICKHSNAVSHYINMERPTSSTSSTAKWFKPSEYSKAKFPKGCSMTKIFHLKEEEPVSFSSPSSEDIDKFVKLCQVNNATSISLYKTLTAIPEEPPSSSQTRAFPPCVKDLFLDAKCPIVPCVKTVKRGKKTFLLGNIENYLEPAYPSKKYVLNTGIHVYWTI